MSEFTEEKIAKDFKIGNTRVRIATDFCDIKTPEQVQKILERIAGTAKQHFASALKKEDSENL